MPGQIDPMAAAQELLKRRSARRSLAAWARLRGFEPAAHHQFIINEIEAFLEGDDDVLLLFAPPGHLADMQADAPKRLLLTQSRRRFESSRRSPQALKCHSV
jgi:hypothetical protein